MIYGHEAYASRADAAFPLTQWAFTILRFWRSMPASSRRRFSILRLALKVDAVGVLHFFAEARARQIAPYRQLDCF